MSWTADIGMRDEPCRADFTATAVEPCRVARESCTQDLESPGLAEQEIVGPVDLTHAAAPQQRNDSIARGDRVTWGESSATDDRVSGGPDTRVNDEPDVEESDTGGISSADQVVADRTQVFHQPGHRTVLVRSRTQQDVRITHRPHLERERARRARSFRLVRQLRPEIAFTNEHASYEAGLRTRRESVAHSSASRTSIERLGTRGLRGDVHALHAHEYTRRRHWDSARAVARRAVRSTVTEEVKWVSSQEPRLESAHQRSIP
jgi:hypothetical protein